MRGRLFFAILLSASMARAAQGKSDNGLRPLVDVMEEVQQNYMGDKKYSEDDLLNAALAGVAGSLDRYSEFLDQQAYKDMREETRGYFGGIGIEIGFIGNKLSVIAPIEGTPADHAGLIGGDWIARIDGVSTDGVKIMDAVHRIKGPPGTKVVLTIIREGSPTRDYSLQRAIITPVNIRFRVIEDIGYAAIRSFSEKTADKLAEALAEFHRKKVVGIILDLRSNPGGLLAEAVKVADLFLPGGKLIVSTEGRDPAQTARFFSTEKLNPETLPLIVMTNDQSASGSEIVAGALQDWGRAVIAGRRTFGKASVQSIQPINKEETKALRLTVARYYTPKHREIHEVGIGADVALPSSRFPSAIRRLADGNMFNGFAAELVSTATLWVDGAALKEGRLAPAPNGEAAGEFEDRVLGEFKRWLRGKGEDISDDDWQESREDALHLVRISVVRRVKGEEAARKMSLEFDRQVNTAADLLRLVRPKLDRESGDPDGNRGAKGQ